MEHPYILFYGEKPAIPVIEKVMTITHINVEPYSFVKQVLDQTTIPTNLTSVPPTDYDSLEDQVTYYFLIAFFIILMVLVSFCCCSGRPG